MTRTPTRTRAGAAVLGAVLLLSGCSDDGSSGAGPDPAPTTSSTVAPSTSASTPTTGSASPSSTPPTTTSTTTVESTTTTPPSTAPPGPTTTLEAEVGIPEGGFGENEGGVPIELDETASLACANTEFARDALAADDVAGALSQLLAAADRAEPSSVAPLAELAPSLRAADAETAPGLVEQVLGICVDLGHQI